MGLELGVLLADASRLDAALDVLDGARDAALFLMDSGVEVAHDPRLAALADADVEIALCAMDAEARGVAPAEHGPRFGSQYDHARLVRDAARVVALTGTGFVDDHRPPPGRRTVRVRLTRDARDGKTAQALRSAVGYAACDLDVVIAVEPPARALLAANGNGNLPQPVLRALGTLRGLGHRIAPAGDAPPAHLEVTW
jgi:hypothetical protein